MTEVLETYTPVRVLMYAVDFTMHWQGGRVQVVTVSTHEDRATAGTAFLAMTIPIMELHDGTGVEMEHTGDRLICTYPNGQVDEYRIREFDLTMTNGHLLREVGETVVCNRCFRSNPNLMQRCRPGGR